jgi:hypothetical protein
MSQNISLEEAQRLPLPYNEEFNGPNPNETGWTLVTKGRKKIKPEPQAEVAVEPLAIATPAPPAELPPPSPTGSATTQNSLRALPNVAPGRLFRTSRKQRNKRGVVQRKLVNEAEIAEGIQNAANELSKTPMVEVNREEENSLPASPATFETEAEVKSVDLYGDILQSPDDIKNWFDNDTNYYTYVYGLGKILKIKQKKLATLASSLDDELKKLNENLDTGLTEMVSTLPITDPVTKDYKKSFNDKVAEDVTTGYKLIFNQKLQQKNKYAEAIRNIEMRRSFVVAMLNLGDRGKECLLSGIFKMASKIYNQYRGERYTPLKNGLFRFIKVIAYTPENFEKSFALNCSITGPAGSGKTTLANLIARWYLVLGILSGDPYYENDTVGLNVVGRTELVAPFLGQTAPKVLGACYSTLEKTLFIDEAYSVAGCQIDDQTGKRKDDAYGNEFVATLLPFMSEHPGIGAFIVAGYAAQMKTCFFDVNEGLPRRFPTSIDLPLYSSDELYSIYINVITDKLVDSYKDTTSVKPPASTFCQLSKGYGEFVESDVVKKAVRRGKELFYVGMKPYLMMLHFDISIPAIEILRKQILLFETQKNLIAQENALNGTSRNDDFEVYSYTILLEVLVAIFSTKIRSHIYRRHFYKQVFNFDVPNLSFFPAQAGEMGLIANKSLFYTETDNYDAILKGKKPVTIEPTQCVTLFNEYFESKKIKPLIHYEDEDGVVSVEIGRYGVDINEVQIQMMTFLLQDIFGTKIPSLKEFYKTLLDTSKFTEILQKVLINYILIAFDTVAQIDAITSDELFPVGMSRSEIFNENNVISSIRVQVESHSDAGGKAFKDIDVQTRKSILQKIIPDHKIYKKEEAELLNYMTKRAAKPGLEHINYSSSADPKQQKINNDCLWEDFGFKI